MRPGRPRDDSHVLRLGMPETVTRRADTRRGDAPCGLKMYAAVHGASQCVATGCRAFGERALVFPVAVRKLVNQRYEAHYVLERILNRRQHA